LPSFAEDWPLNILGEECRNPKILNRASLNSKEKSSCKDKKNKKYKKITQNKKNQAQTLPQKKKNKGKNLHFPSPGPSLGALTRPYDVL